MSQVTFCTICSGNEAKVTIYYGFFHKWHIYTVKKKNLEILSYIVGEADYSTLELKYCQPLVLLSAAPIIKNRISSISKKPLQQCTRVKCHNIPNQDSYWSPQCLREGEGGGSSFLPLVIFFPWLIPRLWRQYLLQPFIAVHSVLQAACRHLQTCSTVHLRRAKGVVTMSLSFLRSCNVSVLGSRGVFYELI